MDLLVPVAPLPSFVCDDNSIRELRSSCYTGAREADAYAEALQQRFDFTGACWRIEGHGVICCTTLSSERAMAEHLRAYLRLRDHADDDTAIAESVSMLRRGVKMNCVWPAEIAPLLSPATTLERISALEMTLHIRHLGGHTPYSECASADVAERISGAWRTVYETLERSVGALKRVGDTRASTKAAALSNESLSHAAGAAAEVAFRRARFSQARQLAAAARDLRPSCPFAISRLATFDLVATNHNEKRLDGHDIPTLLRILPPRIPLVQIIVE